MTYTQNLGSKGLTGVFGRFSLFSYRIAICGDEELCIFSLDFPLEFFLEKQKNGSTGGRRERIFALALL
jgi:hypothetical protein